jgi:hypothetical protein
MIDDQIGWDHRIDDGRIATVGRDGIAQCRQVLEHVDTEGVVSQHPARMEGNFAARRAGARPRYGGFDIRPRDRLAVLVPEQILE